MSFRRRLLLSFVGVAVIVPTAAVVGLVVTARRTELRDLDDALNLEAREELAELRVRPAQDPIHLSTGLIAPEFGTELTRYAALYDPAGNLLIASPSMAHCGGAPKLPRMFPAVGFDLRCGDMTLRAVVRLGRTQRIGYLLMGVSRQSLDADTAYMTRWAIFFVLLSAITASALSVLLTRRLSSGLERIAAATRRVASGDLGARAPIGEGDLEVQELARDVNRMVEQIQALVGAQESFVAHAAHELRSPLTTLYGELALALRRDRSAEEYKRSLVEAHASAQHLKQLAEALLVLARAGREAKPVIESGLLTDAVQRAISSRNGLMTAREVQARVSGDAKQVPVPLTELERIVGNLFENAVKHAPRGTEVHVHWTCSAQAVTLYVDDAGPGIPLDERDRLFEPFYRGPEDRANDSTGFGLGLPIVRELVRKNRGTINVGEAPEGGARFIVTLPISPQGE